MRVIKLLEAPWSRFDVDQSGTIDAWMASVTWFLRASDLRSHTKAGYMAAIFNLRTQSRESA